MGFVTQTGVMHQLESAPMKSMSGIIATATLLFATTALAQAPAGSPDAGRGSAPSPSGTPAPQHELDVHRENGQLRTKEGHKVNTRDGNMQNDGDRDDSGEHSSPGGPTDPSSDPGTLE